MDFNSPQFLVVAGPNGAGKSTTSKLLSPEGAFIFDPDKELAKIATRFPNLPAEIIAYSFQQYFLDCVDTTLKNRAHFVLETNFRDHHLMDTAARFKENGYQVRLLYLTLPNIFYSQDRVRQRVKNGGHDVDPESVRFNFTEGLRNVAYFAGRFDNIEIFDASDGQFRLRSLLKVERRQVIFLNTDLPLAIAGELNEIAGKFGKSQGNNKENDFGLSR